MNKFYRSIARKVRFPVLNPAINTRNLAGIFRKTEAFCDIRKFFIPLLSVCVLSLPQMSVYSYPLPAGGINHPASETSPVKTNATPRKILGNMGFRHEMADLLREKVGPDNSGDVYHAGGLASYYTGPKELFPGKGKLGHFYKFLPVVRWYDPEYYFNSEGFHPGSMVIGEYTNEQCTTCHMIESPGIVTQWKQSKHGTPPEGKEVVGCDRCHGRNHEKLFMPSHTLCGECHENQMKGHRDGGRGSHAQAYHLDIID